MGSLQTATHRVRRSSPGSDQWRKHLAPCGQRPASPSHPAGRSVGPSGNGSAQATLELRTSVTTDIPLHTNNSEGDIRIRVEKRKISGGTRGDEGRHCLDTFVSITKTLRKHALTFWDYLGSRLGMDGPCIPPIGQIIRSAAALQPG